MGVLQSMDTKTLIKDAKARFSHNSAKTYLKEKYNSKNNGDGSLRLITCFRNGFM